MDKVLILEESSVLSWQIAERIQAGTSLTAVIAHTLAEAQSHLEKSPGEFLAAIASLVFERCADGSSITLIHNAGIPVIALSSSVDAKTRSAALDKHAIAYVLKRPECIDQIILLLHRLAANRGRGVLIVDDSASTRAVQSALLKKMNFRSFEATDGHQALALLEKTTGIQMVITDYIMPGMNGLDLVSAIRQKHPFEKMAIIGLSATDDPMLSVQFLKRGASDYLHKPFLEEEFLWRVNSNIQTIELIAKVENASKHDMLTGLANRRCFFETATPILKNPSIPPSTLWLALLDLDKFKSINDTYGHHAGDEALKTTARLLNKHFGGAFCVARLGGEEFCILAQGTDATLSLETFRQNVENSITICEKHKIRFTVSGGLVQGLTADIDTMLQQADALLYQAKQQGRNRILSAQPAEGPT